MLIWPRIFLGWSAVVLIVSALAWAATFSPAYQKCADENAHKKRHAEQAKLDDSVAGGASLGVFLLCEGKFIDENNGTLTAVATVFIAGFTLTLWLAAGRQAKLTRDAIELGNKEFVATHRPRLRVRRIQFDGLVGHKANAWILIANVGESEAINIRFDAKFVERTIMIRIPPWT